MLGITEIKNRFGHHTASIEGPNPAAEQHAVIRHEFVLLASMLDEMLPDGRAKATAFTELETAAMWTHKALAQNSPLEEILEEPLENEDTHIVMVHYDNVVSTVASSSDFGAEEWAITYGYDMYPENIYFFQEKDF